MASTRWLAEYRGTVARGESTQYALFCAKLTLEARKALLDEGFRGIGEGQYPTHIVYCTHQIYRDKGRVRLLFNLALNLEAVRLPAQDKAALEITQVLKHQLEICQHPQFLIRKRTRLEFPWKQEDGELDAYWLTSALVAYRTVLRRFVRLGLANEDVTEIQ